MVFFPCPFFDGLNLVKPLRPTGTSELHPHATSSAKCFWAKQKNHQKQKRQVQIPSSLHLPCPYMYIIHVYTYICLYLYTYKVYWLSWKGISKIPPSHARIWASVRCGCSIEGSHVKVEGQIRRLTFIKRRGWAFQTAKWEASLLGQLREAPARMRLGAKACKWSGGANFAWCGVMWFQGVDLE